LEGAAIGCIFSSEEMVAKASVELRNRGIAAEDIHIGAADAARAEAAAQANGVPADVHPDDPLQGFAEFGDEGAARRAIDRGGVIGAALGAVAGLILSLTPVGSLVPVPHQAQMLANCLLFFVVGTIVGSILGAALAPQQSTHVGFRLIDGMQDGALALVVVVPRNRLDEVQKILQTVGATGITRI
jgi:hypothetical protein